MGRESKMLLFRYKSFNGYDFVSEHNKIIKKMGYTWILKLGTKVKDTSIKEVIDSTGLLLLKAPKSEGGEIYLCNITSFHNGQLEEKNIYPNYYEKIKEEQFLDELDGSWFKVTSMKRISDTACDSLKLCNNNRKLLDVINETRTVIMYVYSDKEELFENSN